MLHITHGRGGKEKVGWERMHEVIGVTSGGHPKIYYV